LNGHIRRHQADRNHPLARKHERTVPGEVADAGSFSLGRASLADIILLFRHPTHRGVHICMAAHVHI
jgi:hypothetical protein